MIESILYAAKMAVGPKQLTEAETRNTASRAFQANSRLSAAEIGRAIGRTRQAVSTYGGVKGKRELKVNDDLC